MQMIRKKLKIDKIETQVVEGDGRQKLTPISAYVLPGTRSMPMSRSQLRALGQALEISGHSNHSASGSTLWAVIAYAYERGLKFDVLRVLDPGGSTLGYHVMLRPE